MVTLRYPPAIFDRLIAEMDERPEQVGFMLAREEGEGVFVVDDLRLVAGHRFDYRDDTRADVENEIRAEMIKWAWDEAACLVEAHSHGGAFVPARFSRFDFSQFEEWVPHVRWRLQKRPYFALVTAGVELDGLAWFGEDAVAIDQIEVESREPLSMTGESFAWLEARRDGP